VDKQNQLRLRRLGVRETRRRLAEVLGDADVGIVTIVTARGRAVAAIISGQCTSRDIAAAKAATRAP
jgi:antitoxin (DNA-binding transcriptional repressor) of toxin-antitoxin stability system